MLATKLIRKGVDVIFDQWDLGLGSDIAKFMEIAITEADRVLMICTEAYVKKANNRQGGVGYESMVVSGEMIRDLGARKFIPIIKQSNAEPVLPTSVSTKVYINLSKEQDFDSQFELLLRDIHNSPLIIKPPIGKKPFSKDSKQSDANYQRYGETNISGLWKGEYGIIKLVQKDNVVIGKYISDKQKVYHDIFLSSVSGKIINDYIVFSWDYRGITKGVGYWKIETDKLNGGWWFHNEAPNFSDLISNPSMLSELINKKHRSWNLIRSIYAEQRH